MNSALAVTGRFKAERVASSIISWAATCCPSASFLVTTVVVTEIIYSPRDINNGSFPLMVKFQDISPSAVPASARCREWEPRVMRSSSQSLKDRIART